MRYLNALPRFLLNLPLQWRICIVILSVLLSEILFVMLPRSLQNPALFTIPIAIVTWISGRRGMLLSILFLTAASWLYYASRTHSLMLTPVLLNNFVLNDGILLIIGLLISSQRDSFAKAEEQQRQFARAYEQEQRLNQAKDRFIQNVNHELRTPLTTLGGYLELLLEHNEFFDATTRANFLRNATLSCEELQLLVNNILDSLQLSSNRMPVILDTISLAPIIQEIIQRADPRWRLDEKVQLNVSGEMCVRAHPQYLRQVLRNLLSNAVKYTPGDQPIIISASLVEGSQMVQPEIWLSIKDFGPGIPPDEIQLLFSQFTRLQRDIMGTVRGTGLGLSICKQLIEAMGGTISVASSGVSGEGCCFLIRLAAPLAAPTSEISVAENLPLAGQAT